MYRTRRCRIRRKRELWEYSRAICVNSARLYNRANFIIRQYATACRDWEVMKPLRENQLETAWSGRSRGAQSMNRKESG